MSALISARPRRTERRRTLRILPIPWYWGPCLNTFGLSIWAPSVLSLLTPLPSYKFLIMGLHATAMRPPVKNFWLCHCKTASKYYVCHCDELTTLKCHCTMHISCSPVTTILSLTNYCKEVFRPRLKFLGCALPTLYNKTYITATRTGKPELDRSTKQIEVA